MSERASRQPLMSEQLTDPTGQTSITMSDRLAHRNGIKIIIIHLIVPSRFPAKPLSSTRPNQNPIGLRLGFRPLPVRPDGYPAPIDFRFPEIHPVFLVSCIVDFSKHACNTHLPIGVCAVQTHLCLYTCML